MYATSYVMSFLILMNCNLCHESTLVDNKSLISDRIGNDTNQNITCFSDANNKCDSVQSSAKDKMVTKECDVLSMFNFEENLSLCHLIQKEVSTGEVLGSYYIQRMKMLMNNLDKDSDINELRKQYGRMCNSSSDPMDGVKLLMKIKSFFDSEYFADLVKKYPELANFNYNDIFITLTEFGKQMKFFYEKLAKKSNSDSPFSKYERAMMIRLNKDTITFQDFVDLTLHGFNKLFDSVMNIRNLIMNNKENNRKINEKYEQAEVLIGKYFVDVIQLLEFSFKNVGDSNFQSGINELFGNFFNKILLDKELDEYLNYFLREVDFYPVIDKHNKVIFDYGKSTTFLLLHFLITLELIQEAKSGVGFLNFEIFSKFLDSYPYFILILDMEYPNEYFYPVEDYKYEKNSICHN